MITEEEYLRAKAIVVEFEKQQKNKPKSQTEFVVYWDTNIGVVYFSNTKEQTTNVEEAKKFPTEKLAKDWIKKQLYGVGCIEQII